MSNEPQNDTIPDSQSNKSIVPKNSNKQIFGTIVVLAGIVAVFSGVSSLFNNTIRLIAPNGNIAVEVMNTGEERALGLSGWESLKDSEGMLFVFDDSSTDNCLWMKDMKFSIDMVWLDEQKNVVTVKSDVSPETYPESFCPSEDAKYVVEVKAGRASQLGLVTNSLVRF